MSLFEMDFQPGGVAGRKKAEQPMRVHTEKGKSIFDKRRFASEEAMLQSMPWHWSRDDLILVITSGDCDSLTLLRHVIRQEPVDYLLLSTWCAGMEDALEIGGWLDRGLVGRLDVYLGEIARSTYAMVSAAFAKAAGKSGGRFGVFRNHSKVMAWYGPRFDGVILSSANVNTNPRTEQATIYCSTAAANFYKGHFDAVHPFNAEEFPDFRPWRRPDD